VVIGLCRDRLGRAAARLGGGFGGWAHALS
jgi:hypothetical protein